MKIHSTVIHIGLGKTGTTTLQKYFFPRLAADKNYLYNPDSFNYISKNKFVFNDIEKKKLREVINKNNVLISNESLVDWNPRNWEKAAKRTLDLFGEEAVIIITLRDPIDYLTSLYVQKIQEGLIISPFDFFVTSNKYDLLQPSLKGKRNVIFDHQSLNYEKLAKIYKEKFKKVFFLPLNLLHSIYPFNRIFSLSSKEITAYKQLIKNAPRVNTSYSKMAIKLTFLKDKIIKKFSFKNPILKNQFIYQKKSNFLIRLFFKSWRWWIQVIFDKIFPYQKYKLPLELINSFDKNLIKQNQCFLKDHSNL